MGFGLVSFKSCKRVGWVMIVSDKSGFLESCKKDFRDRILCHLQVLFYFYNIFHSCSYLGTFKVLFLW